MWQQHAAGQRPAFVWRAMISRGATPVSAATSMSRWKPSHCTASTGAGARAAAGAAGAWWFTFITMGQLQVVMVMVVGFGWWGGGVVGWWGEKK